MSQCHLSCTAEHSDVYSVHFVQITYHIVQHDLHFDAAIQQEHPYPPRLVFPLSYHQPVVCQNACKVHTKFTALVTHVGLMMCMHASFLAIGLTTYYHKS